MIDRENDIRRKEGRKEGRYEEREREKERGITKTIP